MTWKDIPGYEGHYQVNGSGKIKSVARTVKQGTHLRSVRARVMKSGISRGYKMVTLRKSGESAQKYVHRLIAQTLIENPERKLEVNHRDGNKLNNKVSNLEWVTHRENIDHAVKNGLMPSGSDKCNAKFPRNIVKLIRVLYKDGGRIKDIAIALNCSIDNICKVVHRKTYRNVK